MTLSISIPHQRVMFDSGVEGTVRGLLTTGGDGYAHGHLAVSSKSGARRYRVLAGSQHVNSTISIQLEQIQTDPGTIQLASLDVHVLGVSRYPGGGLDADIVLRRLPDASEIMRTTVLLELDEDA